MLWSACVTPIRGAGSSSTCVKALESGGDRLIFHGSLSVALLAFEAVLAPRFRVPVALPFVFAGT